MGPLLLALLACAPQEPNPDRHTSIEPTSSTWTSTTSTTTTATTSSTSWECLDPGSRDTRYFDRLTLPGTVTGTTGLIGVGVAAADFDGDDILDLFLPGQTHSQLFLGTGDPAAPFADHSDRLDSLDIDLAVGAVAVDLDADGHLDILLSRWQRPNALLRNLGDGRFEDATPEAWTRSSWRTQAATAVDLDGDGDLDVFFGSYGERPVDSNDPSMAPADPAELYRNDGADWSDLSATLPPEVHDGYTFQAGFFDVTGDGLPEGFVANDFGEVRPSVRIDNLGGLELKANLRWHPDSEDMGMGVGDVNGDAMPDFLITSAIEVMALQSGEAQGLPGLWSDAAGSWALNVDLPNKRQYFGWGAEWADLDNDGDLDGIATFGNWSDWPTFVEQQDAVWVQESTDPPLFADRGAEPQWDLADSGPGRGIALADLNDDGWLDLVKREVGQEHIVHLSRCGEARSLAVELEGPGSNPRGVGAVLTVEDGSERWTRWITAGGSGMYGGGPPVAHFGLGSRTTVDSVEILWPDGQVDRFEAVPTSRLMTVTRVE